VNKREAHTRARKLWGKKASVAIRPKQERFSWLHGRYNINSGTWACNDGKGRVNIWGNGHSWESAFEDATRRRKYWETAA
jgi:hypothetical protein